MFDIFEITDRRKSRIFLSVSSNFFLYYFPIIEIPRI